MVLVMKWRVTPGVTHSKVLMSEFGKNRFTPMALEGPDGTTTETTVIPTGLTPGMKYSFRVFAGNHYEFENRGSQVDVQMLTPQIGKGVKLLIRILFFRLCSFEKLKIFSKDLIFS